MKTQILALVLAALSAVSCVQASEVNPTSGSSMMNLFPDLSGNAGVLTSLQVTKIADYVAANPAKAASLLKEVSAYAPGQVSEILVAVIKASPDLAPIVTKVVIAQAIKGLSPADAKDKAAQLAAAAVEAAAGTQDKPAEKAKLAAAIATAAVQVVPGSEQAVLDAVAKIVPQATRYLHGSKFFPHVRPPVVVSPSR